MIHEMRLTQQIMYLSPSVEAARQNILQQLFSWEAIITSQIRISSNRYQVDWVSVSFYVYIAQLKVNCFKVGFEKSGTGFNYRNLLAKLPGGQSTLDLAYGAVENLINKVRSYVGVSLSIFKIEFLDYDALIRFISGMASLPGLVGPATGNAV